METLTAAGLISLLTDHEAPCISLYQPTHRRHPENQQDPIRFGNLVKAAEASLRAKYSARDVRDLLGPLLALADDEAFWKHTRDGLAVLTGPGGLLHVYQTQRTLPERVVVADSFHIKPLLRHMQSADRFLVLALTREEATVFSGDRYALDAERLPDDFPARREQVIQEPHSEPGVSVASSNMGVTGPKMLIGHSEGKYDLDTEKYFRAVDRAVTEHFSRPLGVPVVLVSLPEHQAAYRDVSKDAHLLDDGVNVNPGTLSLDELRARAWTVLEPRYLARLSRLEDDFHAAVARRAGSPDLSDVAQAAVGARVGTLLVDADRVLPGVLDRVTGSIRAMDIAHPDADDMLDDLAEVVLSRGGEVIVVPADRMPTDSGLAAIFRY